ncbi:GNAT family N-acetyltransferase [Cellulomonas sp. zg-ZUI188]|uniref:GNAT family N-acetyltransferase n=2 Tax=Cellulomonas fengjieae TaxID=2819978 RepID=A0ABS3SIZ0_9CELL|nr:GNAT family N-acetyltransferase [Cellulomonas fengjieae]QVI67570.1 GNAT family N-acetyltransferase [Cellulomonas fengjieae]
MTMELPEALDLPVREARMRALRDDDWVLDRDLSRVPDVPRWTYYPADLSAERAREWVAHSLAVRADRRGGRFVVEVGGAPVGTVGITLRPDGPSVYYAFLPAGRGGGLATESVRAVARWALADGAPHVDARTMVDNVPSERVLERAGFRRRGLDVGPDGVQLTCWRLARDRQPTKQ